jgi:lactate permease
VFNFLSATGTAICCRTRDGVAIRCRPADLVRTYLHTIARTGPSLVTIAAMLALGYTARYSGQDAILGLAFAHTGVLYPFFGTLLGWLGVALTGSDTSSNVLFGSLQTITANRLGLSPVLMAAANSSGGVMGKMIDAQSICVASTATGGMATSRESAVRVPAQHRARRARRDLGHAASIRLAVLSAGRTLIPPR